MGRTAEKRQGRRNEKVKTRGRTKKTRRGKEEETGDKADTFCVISYQRTVDYLDKMIESVTRWVL